MEVNMRKLPSKREAYRQSYHMMLSFNNGKEEFPKEAVDKAIKAVSDSFKDKDFVYIRTPKKLSFFFKEKDYKTFEPTAINCLVEKLVRPIVFPNF